MFSNSYTLFAEGCMSLLCDTKKCFTQVSFEMTGIKVFITSNDVCLCLLWTDCSGGLL